MPDADAMPFDSSGDAVEADAPPGDAFVDAIADGAIDSEVSSADGDTGADGAGDDASVDAVSVYCGDGIRDPLKEECDDGVTADATAGRTTCTATCRVVDLLAVADSAVVADATVAGAGRTLGTGRHPLVLTDNGFALTFIEPGAKPPRVVITTFDAKGKASDVTTSFGAGASTPIAANPVAAALPGGKVAVAWNDFGGDGDGLGVAVRLLSLPTAPSGAPSFANASTFAAQFDPDILWTGSELVVAWVDASSVARGLDLKYRRFSAALVPLAGEEELATTLDAESDVALASFGSSWIAVWRAARGSQETIQARSGALTWSIGPFAPGPSGAHPAVVQLDSTHAVITFVAGVDGDGGISSELRVAVVDTTTPGSVVASTIATTNAPLEANVVRAGSRTFLAWREAVVVGDARAEEIWLKEISLGSGGLDLSRPAIEGPRDVEHRAGDQRKVAMAGAASSLVLAWDDLGRSLSSSADVVVERVPLPLLRIPAGDGGS